MQILNKYTTNISDLQGFNYYIRENDIILFDDYNEYLEYFANLPVIWSKDEYIQVVSNLHEELFKSYYETYGYEGRDEIPLWFNNSKYGEEAKALSDWYCSTWESLDNHFEVVTEETADAEQIIKSLPIFQYII
jgi:hypothetical protein